MNIESKEFRSELKDYINAVYDICCVAGAIHIVLDDDNLDNRSINWCLQNTIPNVNNYVEKYISARCLELLLMIPENKRLKYLQKYNF